MPIEETSPADHWLTTRSDSKALPPYTYTETDKYEGGLRVYKYSPDAIVIQIRSVTPKQQRITHAYLNKSALRDLIAALQHLETLL